MYPWPPVIPPVRRRHSKWLTVGLPVGLGVALIIGLIVVGVVAISHAVGPARDAAKSYGAAISQARFADAQAMLCARDRDQVTSDQLAAHYSSPPVTGYAVTSVNVEDMNGHTSADATLVLSTADGLRDETDLPLVKESGQWRPCP